MFRWIVIVLAGLLGLSTLSSDWSAVYGSVWFVSLWAVVAVVLAAAVIRHRLYRKPSVLLLHVALLLVLGGGFVTWLTGESGTLRLERGVTVRYMDDASGNAVALPFSICLDSLVIDYYPGRELPREFRSYLTVDGGDAYCVSMNRIAEIDGFRLYQASYDSRGGSVLSVAHDPWGILLTYTGYFLFVAGGMGCMISRHGRFRMLLRSTLAVVMLAGCAADAFAVNGISSAQADSLAYHQVIYKGRVVPYYTVAREFAVKITGCTDPGGLSPVRFMASVAAFPDDWTHVDFILVKDRELRRQLGISGGYISPAALFAENGTYRLSALYKGGTEGMDRAVLDTDERVELILMLRNGSLYSEVQEGDLLRSRVSLSLEIWYYRLSPGLWLFIGAFILALAAALVAFCCNTGRAAVWSAGIFLLMLWCAAYAVRWIIAGRIPLASGGEVLEFVAILLLGLSVVVGRKQPFLFAAGMLMAAFSGLVSWLSDSNPTVTALMPVLASPWLSAHVATIMTSYAVLAFTLPVAIIGLCTRNPLPRRRCGCYLELFTVPGVLLLGIGILLGAMWANVSWGRYWAWDPKETWALITMILYALPLHSTCRFHKPAHNFVYYIIIFLSIPMTYYGVNFLTSLHAYA